MSTKKSFWGHTFIFIDLGFEKLVQGLIMTSRHFGSPGPLPALKKIIKVISYGFVGIEMNIIQAGFLSIYSLL